MGEVDNVVVGGQPGSGQTLQYGVRAGIAGGEFGLVDGAAGSGMPSPGATRRSTMRRAVSA